MLAGAGDERIPIRQYAPVAKALTGFSEVLEVHNKLLRDEKKTQAREAIAKEIREARLGYARVCFASDNDLGRGPTIRRGVLNPRSIRQGGVTHLKNLHGNGRLNQYSTDTTYHITMVIRKSAFKAESLTQNITQDPYPMIEWVDNITEVIQASKGDLALVTDGNHRATACEQLGAEAKKTYLNSKIALGNMSTERANSNLAKVHWDTVEKAEGLLRKMCSWNVVVYDWGECITYSTK